MSVRVITRVLNESASVGTPRLMLLVLADYSDDAGNSYPAVASLARKCNTSMRNANFLLAALQASGELEVGRCKGPKGTNRYRIVLPLKQPSPPTPEEPFTPPPEAAFTPQGAEAAFTPEDAFTLKAATDTPEGCYRLPLKQPSPEPSLNRQEPLLPSLERPDTATKTKIPKCPDAEIVKAFHEILPELPRVHLIKTKKHQRSLKGFWEFAMTSLKSDGTRRATTAEEALAWTRAYFQRARSSDFIMARTPPGQGHEGWVADIDYVLSEKGLIRVIENTKEAVS